VSARSDAATADELDRVAAEVGRHLRRRGESLALAESCTGGLIAATLTGIPGASEFLWGSAVVYTAAAKIELAGLDEAVLRAHGTVSAPTSEALAVAVRARSAATWGLAVTGWAGPEAGEGEEVGVVFGALADAGAVSSCRWRFVGDRNEIRRSAAAAVLDLLRRRLEEAQDVGDDSQAADRPADGGTSGGDS